MNETFSVEYTQNNVDCYMEVQAADLQTAKQAVKQWRVGKLRHRNDTIKITRIAPLPHGALAIGPL
jgi:hypothetical protein